MTKLGENNSSAGILPQINQRLKEFIPSFPRHLNIG